MFYLFQLGHEPQLSAAEIHAVVFSAQKHLPDMPDGKSWRAGENTKTLKHQNNNYLILETDEKIDASKLMGILGGTIKIGCGIRDAGYGKNDIINETIKYLQETQPTGKINFSLNDSKLALQIKKELKNLGRSVRYIEPKNTATILYNGLIDKKTDLTIIDNQIFYTEAIQQFEEMAERDYGRPGVDDKSGMLPPKLARMMINLAVSSVETRRGASLLDPFCGSGTVLTEALSMGYTNLIGSDISSKAVEDTKKNLDWLSQKQSNNLTIEQSNNIQLFISDSIRLSTQLKPSSVDTIVTEPYLGKPLHGNESEFVIKKQITELSELYLDSFKEFYKILKPNGVVVIVIPKFKFKNDWIEIEIENQIEQIGFEIVSFTVETRSFASLQYHRPNQHLAREIYRFKKIP